MAALQYLVGGRLKLQPPVSCVRTDVSALAAVLEKYSSYLTKSEDNNSERMFIDLGKVRSVQLMCS